MADPDPHHYHVSIEGNIGVGKTTFLSETQRHFLAEGIPTSIYPEPVQIWTQFGSEKLNLLQKMYDEPSRYAFHFQMGAALTKCDQFVEMVGLCTVERSIWAQQMVFAPHLKEKGWLTVLECELLEGLYNRLLNTPFVKPDLIIYYRATPAVCLERVKKRNRVEENGITIEYLCELHQLYDKWLLGNCTVPVIVLDAEKQDSVWRKDIWREIQHRLPISEEYVETGHLKKTEK